ncbi:lantibiotic dehydratase [Pyxidicoccus parkwayensis]|uniref:Lantibiotic dehydratase n=1 Tax=Pyxidicoccus parkwayensis TaxID=2813578 RepID=A0ABX7NJA1_9BACT|nr:lantibiotic dehydratase [Pyxidicoccus parkwaysis]QSQ18947.1 lantibiotic dehydratase [Pyxidicoccus parkwaysis]
MTAPLAALPGYTTSGFFVLRSPLLPFDALLAWSAGAGEDRALLRGRLEENLARGELREALFLASPSLDEGLAEWHRAPESEWGQKVERALVRYWQRMAARATPFGLFAGHTVGTLGPSTRLTLEARETYRRHTRLDMDYVSALSERLAREPALREALRYRPNSSLYRSAGKLRYAESHMTGRTRAYQLVAVEPTDYLEATLERARPGAPLSELVQALVDADPDVAREEAEAYVSMLVDHQLLVPELPPRVTGPEPLDELLARLAPVPALVDYHQRLERVRSALADLDASPPGSAPSVYRAIARELEALPTPVEPSRLFQVDLVKPGAALTLGPPVVEEMARGAALLHRISHASESPSLRRFREAFVQRYEGREVPLVEALDDDVGIGFEAGNPIFAEGSPLLRGLDFPADAAEARQPWGPGQAHLQHRVTELLRSGAHALELDEADLKALENPRPGPLPEAFSIMAGVLAASPADLDAGRFQVVLESVLGPSGALLLGRFCHVDPELHRHVEAHLRTEEALHPDALFAELVHLPEGRVGNVISRPVLRDYELVYLGHSGAPVAKQIPITDLRVSVQGRRIVLRSASLGREVLPRMTHVHNFGGAHLRPYTFLATLQQEGVSPGLRWTWGPLSDSAFLPRVTAGRLILFRARWRLLATTLRALGEVPEAERFQATQRLRAELRLPRFVGVEDRDNVLPVDLDNALSIDTFVHLVKDRTHAVLVELLTEGLCVQGPEGRFVHELVVPFVRTTPLARQPPRATSPVRPIPIGRVFAPGSEWLYAKLYTGTATADAVLRDVVAPVAREALASGAANQWFFIRYGDPDWHVRVRFQGNPARLRTEVLARLHEALAPSLGAGLVHRVQLDTYEREVERYGGDEGLLISEHLFHVDSEAALELLDTCVGEAGADARWRLTLRGIDALLDDLGLDLEARRQLLEGLREAHGKEFQVDGAFERQLGERFRAHRRELEALLWNPPSPESPLAPGLAVLRRRSERNAPLMERLKALSLEGMLGQPLPHVAASLAHMHANRMLRSAARAQELVLYDFLHRLYESRVARQRRGV